MYEDMHIERMRVYVCTRILYSRKLSREKTFVDQYNNNYYRKGTFCGMLTDHIDGCGMPKISWRKLSWVAVKVFSLESFPLYGICL